MNGDPPPGIDGTVPPPPIDPQRIEYNWMAISTELFTPQPSRVERWLRWLRIPPTTTRLMVATPALRRAWFLALGLVMLIGLGAGDGDRTGGQLSVLLLLAPLVPVLGVTMAYGPSSDPAHETSVATPLSGFRLVMIRSATVVVCSVGLLALASLLSGALSPLTFGWLLPALGLTSASLALMTFTAPRRAGTIAAVAWVVGVLVARGVASDPQVAFAVAGQLLMLTLGGVGLIVSYLRRDRFELLRAEL